LHTYGLQYLLGEVRPNLFYLYVQKLDIHWKKKDHTWLSMQWRS